ncbi:hypothetical protein UlMin_031094 [Ulmus minor]
MDLGCLDMGCITVSDKVTSETVLDSGSKENDSGVATSKIGKIKNSKENGQSPLCSLSRFTSQIKKPGHRKSSPINWFPRKKVDSYLNRKIKRLQEVAGMNLTLDETLGDSNPHYSKVLREKMAAREAAHKAMEARRAALVEASWCRILKASRIQSKEADAQLLKAEETAVEAFEAATAIGVIMYDMPNCPRKPCEVETSSTQEGSTTHAVTASFETAFEVDIEVAAAVKTALVRLANSPSIKKDEFKDLLRRISQNPDTGGSDEEQSDFSSSECESESVKESVEEGVISQDLDHKMSASEVRRRKHKRRLSLEKLNMTKLVDMMLERLQLLQEDELSSLATIVATCGLNAVLDEVENKKLHDSGPADISNPSLNYHRRLSSWGAGKNEYKDGNIRKKQIEPELPSLDKFLVKRMTKLEREVQEARNSRKNESKESLVENSVDTCRDKVDPNTVEAISEDLGSMLLIKHSSKLEKEIEEAKRNAAERTEGIPIRAASRSIKDVPELPSLDKFLVKRVSRLEREVQEAKDRRKNLKKKVNPSDGQQGKENADLNKEANLSSEQNEDSLDKILVKPVHRLEREKMQALAMGSNYGYEKHKKKEAEQSVTEWESLDKVFVKHVSKLEKEKLRFGLEEDSMRVKNKNTKMQSETDERGGLDQILVKHKPRLEREKMIAAQQPEDHINPSVNRREAREREMQEAWGGLGLGSMKPHISKLERDKAAWIKAEEEERRQPALLD